MWANTTGTLTITGGGYHSKGKETVSIAIKTSALCYTTICKAAEVGALCSMLTFNHKTYMLGSPNSHTNCTTRWFGLVLFIYTWSQLGDIWCHV